MIDAFVNYLLGIEFLDRFRYRLEAPKEKSITIHHIPSSFIVNRLSVTPSCINLIDTPGFSTDYKNDNLDALCLLRKMFINLSDVDQIIHCVNPNDGGLGSIHKYARDQIKSLYANDLSSRVIEV